MSARRLVVGAVPRRPSLGAVHWGRPRPRQGCQDEMMLAQPAMCRPILRGTWPGYPYAGPKPVVSA
jgi:hypothetical protein